MTGIERLRVVRGHMPETGRNTKRTLKLAAAEFEAAFRADAHDWPLKFRRSADSIRLVLTQHGGTDETIDRLRPADVTQALASLRLFCEEAERAVR